MAYNNYGRRTYQKNWGKGNSYSYGGSKRFQPSGKKRSSCEVRKDFVAKSGAKKALFIKGWKYTKGTGLFSFVAVPAKKQTRKDGSKYPNHTVMVVSVKTKTGSSTEWGFWNFGKQVLSIPSMRLVAAQGYVSYLKPKNFR